MEHPSFSASARRRPCARFELELKPGGNWVLRDAEGLGYAIFSSYDEAMLYALEETGGVREAITLREHDAPHDSRHT